MKRLAGTPTIVARLIAASDQMGFSQTDLAQRSAIKQSQISKLARGKVTSPSLDTVLSLCWALQLSPTAVCAEDPQWFEAELAINIKKGNIKQLIHPVSREEFAEIVKYRNQPELIVTTRSGRQVHVVKAPPTQDLSAQQLTAMRSSFVTLLEKTESALRLIVAPDQQGQHQTLALLMPSSRRPGTDLVANAFGQTTPYSSANLIDDARALAELKPLMVHGVDTDKQSFDDRAFPNHLATAASVAIERDHIRTSRYGVVIERFVWPSVVQDGWVHDMAQGLDAVVCIDAALADNASWLRHARQRRIKYQADLSHIQRKGHLMDYAKQKQLADCETLIAMVETLQTRMYTVSMRMIFRADSLSQAQVQADQAMREYSWRLADYQQREGYRAGLIGEPLAGGKPTSYLLHSQGLASMLLPAPNQ